MGFTVPRACYPGMLHQTLGLDHGPTFFKLSKTMLQFHIHLFCALEMSALQILHCPQINSLVRRGNCLLRLRRPLIARKFRLRCLPQIYI